MTGKKDENDGGNDVIVSSMKGVPKSAGFAITSDGAIGIAYNEPLDQFAIINLENDEQYALNKDPLVNVKKVDRWEGLHIVQDQSMCIVLVLAVEKRTNKTYLISFTEDKEEKRMKVLHELDLGVLDPKDGKEGNKKRSYISDDGHGAIYCYTTWLDFNDSEKKATFHAVKVTVDGKGKIQQKIVFNGCCVEGAHMKLPLADRSAIYMLPVHNEYDEEKIVKLALDGASGPTTIHPKYGEGGMPPFFCPWSQPIHLDDNTAIFYAYGLVGSRRVGQFWTLSLPEGQWRKLNFELQEHPVKDNISILRDANDDTLLLHGDCADENCADKAHIYRFNFDKRKHHKSECSESMAMPKREIHPRTKKVQNSVPSFPRRQSKRRNTWTADQNED